MNLNLIWITRWVLIEDIWKSYMCAAVKKQIQEILADINNTELVVEIRPEKFGSGFELITSAIPVQCSTNWANKPTGSWSLCWVKINLPSDEEWFYRYENRLFFLEGTVTNPAIWLVLYPVSIFLSLPTGNGNAFVSRRVHPHFRCHFS